MMPKILRLLLFAALFFLFDGVIARAEDNSVGAPPIVGGPCDYKQYEGRARLTAITQRDYPNNDSYEVKFLFYPAQEIVEPYAQFEGRELLLLTKRGSYPKAAFLQANGIEVGKDLACVLKVIIKGTCTPTIFEFPSLIE